MDELGLPGASQTSHPLSKRTDSRHRSVGSGKSTTLAALVDQVNIERREHIITLEDPIEYVFGTERLPHHPTRSAHPHPLVRGGVARRAPRRSGFIMVGEMRDLETISLAITAAETGHLVLGTAPHQQRFTHARSICSTSFPPDQQEQVRIMVRRIAPRRHQSATNPAGGWERTRTGFGNTDQHPGGRERDSRSQDIHAPGIIQTGKKQGMQLMDDALIELSEPWSNHGRRSLSSRRTKTGNEVTAEDVKTPMPKPKLQANPKPLQGNRRAGAQRFRFGTLELEFGHWGFHVFSRDFISCFCSARAKASSA